MAVIGRQHEVILFSGGQSGPALPTPRLPVPFRRLRHGSRVRASATSPNTCPGCRRAAPKPALQPRPPGGKKPPARRLRKQWRNYSKFKHRRAAIPSSPTKNLRMACRIIRLIGSPSHSFHKRDHVANRLDPAATAAA